MSTAATTTAEFGHDLNGKTGNKDSVYPALCRSQTQHGHSDSNGHHRPTANGDANPLDKQHSTSLISKARREFFLDPNSGRCRNSKISDTTSGYGSNSSGESDSAEENGIRRSSAGINGHYENGRTAASCPQSPETKGDGTKNGTAFSPPSSSSSAASLTFSSAASLGGCNSDLKSTYTEEILKVLAEDGLIIQACPRDNLPPLPVSLVQRRASADYNVIELSRQYRKKELSQLRSSSERFQHISDIYRLQQMLASTDDEDKRRAIKKRLVELTSQSNGTTQRAGQRARSLSTREVVTHEGSPTKDANGLLGGIASLTVSPCSRTARSSPTSSPAANGHKSTTPTGHVTRIIARTPAEIKAALLRWCQIKTRGYPGVLITNFTRSWADGLAFCALVHHFFPDAFDFSKLDAKNRRENFEVAFRVAEEMAGIVPLLDVDDMISMGDNPEYKCVYTYIQTMYRNLHELEQ